MYLFTRPFSLQRIFLGIPKRMAIIKWRHRVTQITVLGETLVSISASASIIFCRLKLINTLHSSFISLNNQFQPGLRVNFFLMSSEVIFGLFERDLRQKS